MLGKTHLLGGALLAGCVHYVLGSGYSFVVPMALGAAMGLMPDLDQRHKLGFHMREMVKGTLVVLLGLSLTVMFDPAIGWSGQALSLGLLVPVTMLTFLVLWFGIAPFFSRIDVKHRGVTHSLMGWLVFALITWGLDQGGRMAGLSGIPSHWRLAMHAGYASHILLDMCTVEGVHLLYPIRRAIHIPLIPKCVTGSGGEVFWQGLLTGGLMVLVAQLVW